MITLDDASVDNSRGVLAPYIAKGLVTVFEPPFQGQTYRQAAAFKNTLISLMSKNEAKWIAFLDVDEFLWSPKEFNVQNILKTHEDLASIGLSWMWYGSSGNIEQPASVVQSFTKRANFTSYKSFVKISEAYKILKVFAQLFISA